MGRKIPVWQCILVLLVMTGLLVWAITKDSAGEAHIGLILAAIFAGVVAVANGWKWSFLEAGILAAINRSMQACLILAVVGAMLAAWMAGGTIPTMMYYGIKVIAPGVFLFTACLLCSIVSLATGSSWSTAGSMGIALIGVGTALGFPTAMTAGAVVSGAYFGDKMSPLSDTTNLAPAVAGSNLFDHIRHMIWTTGPSLVIALIAYLVLGIKHSAATEVDIGTINEILGFIESASTINLLYLIPPVFVIAAVALKLPALPSLMGGVLIAIPFMLMNGTEITSVMDILNNGITLGEVPEDASLMMQKLGALLNGKGLQGMMWTVSLILCAMCFGGIVDCTGIMGSVAGGMLKLAKGTRGGLVVVTVFTAIVVNAICCDQYLAIILPGRMYKEAFEDMKLKPKNLSRCLEDSGTITSNFFPWNTCGATMRSFLGVGSAYIPYAILNWLNPLISIFYGFTGISMEKMIDEEYARILEMRAAEKEAALKGMEG
ncbi:MAG: Na+/H+ antiporter NhaC [Firmicutes bacterium]|nr:Na+/H+ antiporter NhaC [Bacillota bacterium]